jgi:hypothetical protein
MLTQTLPAGVCALFLIAAHGIYAQTISTVAGTGEPGFSGDGGPATAATFSDPRSVGVDAAGNLFILDSNNFRIRKVSTNGVVNTVIGNGVAGWPVRGLATKTPFGASDFVVMKNSMVYASEPSGIYKIDQNGALSLFAEQNDSNMTLSATGAIYTANISTVHRVNSNGASGPVAGGDLGDSGDGGPAIKAKFAVSGLAADILGNVYIADNQSNKIRKFTPGGNISTLAGMGTFGFSGDGGPALKAQFANPNGIAVDVAGNVYVADTSNYRVRRITPEGIISTFAGNGQQDAKGDGGPARAASFGTVFHMVLSCEALYVTDVERIRKITLTDPLIAQRGVTDFAKPAGALVSGARISVTGCNLAPSRAAAPAEAADAQLPKSLLGTSVLVNGTPVGLISVSREQIVAQLPPGVNGSATLKVQAQRAGSNTTALTIAAR